jgi:hypothetical protein
LLPFICEDERRDGVGKAVISSPTEKAQIEGKPVLTRDILFETNILTLGGFIVMGAHAHPEPYGASR